MNNLSIRRSLIILGLMSMLLLSVSATAQSSSDLLSAARWIPADTDIYISFRSDEAFIDKLDGIVNRLMAEIETALPAQLRSTSEADRALNLVRTQLDAFAMSWGGSFDDVFSPWLGESVSIGVDFSPLEPEPSVVFVIENINRDAAMAFLDAGIGLDRMLESESSGFVLFDPKNRLAQTYIAISDSTLIYASTPALRLSNSTTLAENADFQQTFAQLPEPQYSLLAYLDLSLIMEMAASNTADPATIPLLEELAKIAGVAVLGVDVRDDRVLLVDIAQQVASTPLFGSSRPGGAGAGLNPSFLRHVPTDATLILHGTDLKGRYESLVEGMRVMAAQGWIEGMDEVQVDQTFTQLEVAIALITGVNFSNDIISWMTGDYALFLKYDPPPPGKPSLGTMGMFMGGAEPIDLGLEFGIVIETTDAEASAKLVTGIQRAIDWLGEGSTRTSRTHIAGTDALVITLPSMGVTLNNLIVASNDSVFFFGTEKAAVTAMSGSGGMNKITAYQTAQRYSLRDTPLQYYFDGPGLITLFGDLVTGSSGSDPTVDALIEDIINLTTTGTPPQSQHDQITWVQQIVRNISHVIESVAFTTASSDDVTLNRMTLILGDF